MSKEQQKAPAVDTTLANPDVLQRYREAAEISQRALAHVKELCVDGARIIDICVSGDQFISDACAKIYKGKNVVKGIAFPTAVSPDHVATHLSPLPQDPEAEMQLRTGQLVKVSLGAQLDGYASVLADSFIVGGGRVEGRRADVLRAAYEATEFAVRTIAPGNKNWDVTQGVQKIAEAYDCKPVEGMLSHQQTQNVIDGKKQIIINPSEGQRKAMETCTFDVNEVYGVDIIIATGDGHVRRTEAATRIYKKATDVTYNLKLQTSRRTFAEIQRKAGAFPFTLRGLDDEKKARMGVQEAVQHNLLVPYDVLYEREGEYVAQFFSTIALTKNGTVRLTGPTDFDVSILGNECKLGDELKSVIDTPIKLAKKKKSGSKGKKSAEAETESAPAA